MDMRLIPIVGKFLLWSYNFQEVFNLIRGRTDGQKLVARYKPSERSEVFKVGGRGINEWDNYFLISTSFRISPVC